MQRKIPRSAKQRLRVGRTQKFSASAYKLRNVIQWENYNWIFILFLTTIIHFIFFSKLIQLSQQVGFEFIAGLGVSTAIILYSSIIGRILLNVLVRELLKYGMSKDNHILNTITSFLNGAVALTLFAGSFAISLFGGIGLFEIRKPLWQLVKSLVIGNPVSDPSLLLSIIASLALYFSIVALTLFLFFNALRSLVNLVNTFILLPAQNTISSRLRIKNYHHSDSMHLQRVYIQSLKQNYPQTTFTQNDWELFLQASDPRCIRVLLEYGVPIGFYLTSDKGDSIQTMMIDQEHKGHHLHEEFLRDFEIVARKKFAKRIEVSLPAHDTRTIGFLTNHGWIREHKENDGKIRMKKTLAKELRKS